MRKDAPRKAAPPKAKPAAKKAAKRVVKRAAKPAAKPKAEPEPRTTAPRAVSSYDAARHPVTLYALDVVAGRVVAGKQVIASCRRHLRDLDRAAKPGATLRFNAALADRAVKFCSLLALTKGKGAGAPLHLEPWQVFVVGSLFGWQRITAAGKWVRRFRIAYVEIARKNGKTTLAAAIALYLMLADGEHGPEIYAGATKYDQAMIVWDEARAMVRASASLRKIVRALRRPPLVCEARRAKFDVLSADADTADGLNVHGAIVDEYHEHKTRALYDVLETGTGAREQPLILVITTAGADRTSPCWAERDYTQKVVEGVIEDDTRFGYVAELDEDDDWRDEACWAKANPNLGVNVDIADLRDKAKRAAQMTSYLNEFLRKHLNVWTQSEVRWIEPQAWAECATTIADDDLIGLPCAAGLDLGDTGDFTAAVFAFELPDRRIALRPYFWVPEESNVRRSDRDLRLIAEWAQTGVLEYAGARRVSHDVLIERIADLCARYSPRRVGYDRYTAEHIASTLTEKHGVPMVEIVQSFAGMTGGTRAFEALVAERRLAHDGNPVLRWMADNVVLMSDSNGNIRPNKARAREKIDGIVAAIMAVDALMRSENDAPASVYATRGIRVIG